MTDKAPEIKKWNVLATVFWLSFSIAWVVIAIYVATRLEPQPAIPSNPCLSCHISYNDVFQLVRAESRERAKRQDEVIRNQKKLYQKVDEIITAWNQFNRTNKGADPFEPGWGDIEHLGRE